MTCFTKVSAALAVLLSFAVPAQAALLSSTGQVSSLRIEGTAGFIGRTTYANAMMAFAMKQNVTIRAHEDSAKVFGECQLYDIWVY